MYPDDLVCFPAQESLPGESPPCETAHKVCLEASAKVGLSSALVFCAFKTRFISCGAKDGSEDGSEDVD